MSRFVKVGTRRINLDQIRDVYTVHPPKLYQDEHDTVTINFVAMDADGCTEIHLDDTEAAEFLRILDREIEISSAGGRS